MSDLLLVTDPFVYRGLIVGSAVAVLCGLVGFFTVLRGQVFAGDALSHVSYTGAVAAVAIGVDLRFGLFAATLAVGAVLGLIGGRWVADDVVIGTTFAWILGLGVLFVSLYNSTGGGTDGSVTVSVLFGSIYGVSASSAVVGVGIAVGLLVVMLVIGRPLLFASVDPVVAAARGVPVRALNTGFLLVVAAAAAEITQVVGAVLLLGLLAAPAGAASRLTTRPWRAAGLSVAIAVMSVWVGVAVSLLLAQVPVSFGVVAFAALVYLVAVLVPRRPPHRSLGPGGTVPASLPVSLPASPSRGERDSLASRSVHPTPRRAGDPRWVCSTRSASTVASPSSPAATGDWAARSRPPWARPVPRSPSSPGTPPRPTGPSPGSGPTGSPPPGSAPT